MLYRCTIVYIKSRDKERAENKMAGISRNFQEAGAVTKPVVITNVTKAVVLNTLPEASECISTKAVALEYEVFCPNCARVEVGSTLNQSKHRCNCGYGVSVEMLRTSPN